MSAPSIDPKQLRASVALDTLECERLKSLTSQQLAAELHELWAVLSLRRSVIPDPERFNDDLLIEEVLNRLDPLWEMHPLPPDIQRQQQALQHRRRRLFRRILGLD